MQEEEELCHIHNKDTNSFLLEYMKKYYDNSLLKFTEVYSKLFKLEKKRENNIDKIITRCFISRVYWRKLLTGLHPEENDHIFIKCENDIQLNKKSTINCHKKSNGVETNFEINLNSFFNGFDWNNKVFSYVLHPDHEFNILIENNNMYLIQSWLYQYPLRIYNLTGNKEYKKFVEILNDLLVNIYKLNLKPNTINKIFYKLFMCYREKIYVINNNKIIFRTIDDEYVFNINISNKKKQFKKKFKVMINNFTLNNKLICSQNIKNQNIQKGSAKENNFLDKKVYLIITNIIDNYKKNIFIVNTNCDSKEAIIREYIIKFRDNELNIFLITIKKNQDDLNFVYFNSLRNEIFIKMDNDIFGILLDQFTNKNLDSENIHFLIGLYFGQLLLDIDLSNSGHAYYKMTNSNIVSIKKNNQKIIKLYNNNKSFEFESNDEKELINNLISIFNLANKNTQKYTELLNKHKISEKIMKMISKMDYLDINSFYDKISGKFMNYHNNKDNSAPLHYFLSIYIHLASYNGEMGNKKKLRIFINTLYSDINKEMMIVNKYYDKYNKYKQKYLSLTK